MKLSLPALLDAGRRFTAGLAMPRPRRQAFTRQQLRQARRGFFLLGLTLATFIALHPPAARAQDWNDSGDHLHPNDFGYLNTQAPKQ